MWSFAAPFARCSGCSSSRRPRHAEPVPRHRGEAQPGGHRPGMKVPEVAHPLPRVRTVHRRRRPAPRRAAAGPLLSYSFLIMLLTSTYTANLTAIPHLAGGEQARFCRTRSTRASACACTTAPRHHEWLASAYPKANIVPIASGGAWAGPPTRTSRATSRCGRLARSRCRTPARTRVRARAVGTNSGACVAAGWMAGVDYNDRCSSLLIDVLSYWLLELGPRHRRRARPRSRRRRAGEPREDGALGVKDKAASSSCRIMRAASPPVPVAVHNAKCAGVGDALESGGGGDDRPTTAGHRASTTSSPRSTARLWRCIQHEQGDRPAAADAAVDVGRCGGRVAAAHHRAGAKYADAQHLGRLWSQSASDVVDAGVALGPPTRCCCASRNTGRSRRFATQAGREHGCKRWQVAARSWAGLVAPAHGT